MKEFANWHHPQSYFTRVVSMRDFSKFLTYRCAILWSLFRDVDASVSLIHPPYATINSIYCSVGCLNKKYWSSDIPKMGAQIYTWVFLLYWLYFTVHLPCNLPLLNFLSMIKCHLPTQDWAPRTGTYQI